MKQAMAKEALISTLPVLAGYLVLGFGFGMIMHENGYGVLPVLAMSLLVYAGSMQYVAIGLFTSGATLLTTAFTTLMVNARHLFYGISMLERYREMGKRKPYLIFSLTDETYSLVCTDAPHIPLEGRRDYFLFVSLFNHFYWVVGSLFGAVIGSLLHFNSQGLDFALTALFLTVFLEQWLGTKKHVPALVGVISSVFCLLIFGSKSFLVPAMIMIVVLLCFYREEDKNG